MGKLLVANYLEGSTLRRLEILEEVLGLLILRTEIIEEITRGGHFLLYYLFTLPLKQPSNFFFGLKAEKTKPL
jgi:hypothetical protein